MDTGGKMKVIFISTAVMPLPPLSYAGVERLVYQLADGFSKHGIDTYLVAPTGTRPPKNVKFIDMGVSGWNNNEEQAYINYKPLLEKIIDNDTIISDHSWAGYPYLMKIANPKIKMTHTFHALQPWKVPKQKILKEEFESGEWHFIGVSKALSKRLSVLMNAPVDTIYNGVDEKDFKFYEGDRDDYLLFFGVINREKGVDNFIDIVGTRYRAKIAGEDEHVTDVNFVRGIIDYINRETPNIDYYGKVLHSEKLYLMQKALLMVYPYNPSWFEAFNLAFIEASMVGTPVLVSESGSMLELTEGLPEIFRAKPNNRILAEDLPKIIDELHKNFNYYSRKFRENAMRFTLDKMIENYIKYFEKIT